MAKARLTKVQKEQLREYGPLFVSYHGSAIMRTFNKLVEKGYAQETDRISGSGKQFEIVLTEQA